MLKLLQFIDQLPLEKPEGKLHDWVTNVNFLSTILTHNQEKTLLEWIKRKMKGEMFWSFIKFYQRIR